MDFLKNALNPLVGGRNGALPDTLKLVVLGGTVETARRVSASAWNNFVDSFFLTAHFSQDDHPYDWIMHWLSKQPAWGRSREFDITTRTVTRNATEHANDFEDEEALADETYGERRKRKIAFEPSADTTHTIYYSGHWLRITRSKKFKEYCHGYELKISVVARSNDILKKLVLESKRMYEKDAEHRVHIFMADPTYGGWRYNGSRQKRPMSSIVLEPVVKEMLLDDCKDFLESEDWYADRGIPFRRGYLLHGVPGSGKTSLIHSTAGELGLDIYVISLSTKGMNDNTLSTLMGQVPSRCILLLEDLDAAFTRSVSRDAASTGAPESGTAATAATTPSSILPEVKVADDGNSLSLSGLLNALDGVAAAEGRLLFATTNHIERLDPALSRPGRMDVWIDFKHATRFQAEGIFRNFFPVATGKPTPSTSSPSPSPSAAIGNGPRLGVQGRASSANAILNEDELDKLAKAFAGAIPENEFSVASLQGYLLKNKSRPRQCVAEVDQWIKTERETKEKLKKEKEAALAKVKQEAEEAAAKEKALKDALEKEVQAAKEKEEAEAKLKEDIVKSDKSSVKLRTKKSRTESKLTPPSSDLKANNSESSGSSTSSSAEDGCSTGIEGDTEESMTSEEEAPGRKTATTPTEKWVSVKTEAASVS